MGQDWIQLIRDLVVIFGALWLLNIVMKPRQRQLQAQAIRESSADRQSG